MLTPYFFNYKDSQLSPGVYVAPAKLQMVAPNPLYGPLMNLVANQHWQPHRVAEPSFTNLCCSTFLSNADGGPQPAVRPPDEPGSHQHQRPCTSTRLQLVQRERNKGGENKASGAAAVRHGWCGVAWCPALPLLLQNSTDTTKEGRSETCTQQASVTAAAHQKLAALLA